MTPVPAICSSWPERSANRFKKALGRKLRLVGDDNFVTNPKIFAAGIKACIANAILIRLK